MCVFFFVFIFYSVCYCFFFSFFFILVIFLSTVDRFLGKCIRMPKLLSSSSMLWIIPMYCVLHVNY